ncbi:MAG: phosphatase PAP2 family protein [Burkholderiaceae bacterium]
MQFWQVLTPLGESLILMPAVGVLAAWLLPRKQGSTLVWRWLLAVGAAALITACSKIAFMGWGLGSAQWNFTGISGHTMFAAAIYPLLFRTVVSAAPPRYHSASIVAGFVLAALIGVSRVRIGAHSWSEVVTGYGLGGLASLLVLGLAYVPPARPPRWLLAGVALWLGVMMIGAPHSPAHGWITQVALTLSGRQTPYTRSDLFRATPQTGTTAAQRFSWHQPVSAIGSALRPRT